MVQPRLSAPHSSYSFTKLLEDSDKGLNRRCVRFFNDRADWQIYFDQELVIYATNSLESLERLERQLKRISRGYNNGVSVLKPWMRSHLENFFENDKNARLAPDYQSIQWLMGQGVLNQETASILVQRITLEVLETALLCNESNWQQQVELLSATEPMPIFDRLELSGLLAQLKHRLSRWQKMGSAINSPYQRPYFSSNKQALRRLSPEMMEKLGRLLKGFNFRQLSALLNQDELVVAQRLYPLITEGLVVLREPEAPFQDFPRLSSIPLNFRSSAEESLGKSTVSTRPKPEIFNQTEAGNVIPTEPKPTSVSPESLRSSASVYQSVEFIDDTPSGGLTGMMSSLAASQVWKVVCVDDSEAMLKEISRLLDNESLSITTISDPTKALIQICTIVPDIVLLDVGMPGIDGYQICQLIRKVPRLKDIPIVMVTGNKGLIDRAKARLAGATDYLTKPFDQQDLIAMVFRYLS